MEKFHTKPGKIIMAGLLVIGLFFGGLGTIAVYMPFSGAVVAPGTVVVSQNKKAVQHLEGGIVDEILIKDGDRVKRGDVLIRLRSMRIASTTDLLQGRIYTKTAEADRLRAQMVLKKNITWSQLLIQEKENNEEIRELLLREADLFETQKDSLESRIETQKARIKQLEELIIGAGEELKAEEEIIASLKGEIRSKEGLLKDKFIDETQILTLRRMLAQHGGARARLVQSIAESQEKIQEINFSIASLKNIYQETAGGEFSKATDEIFNLTEQLRPQQDAKERLNIQAPVSGIIVNLQIHSEEGGVVRPGETLLEIVPENAELIVESRLRQDQITKVHVGQQARVQLSAFNRITTPPVGGVVTHISADMITDQTPMGRASFYLVHATVNADELKAHDAYLSPGMPAVCYITTEKRTFFQYLLEPILLNFDQSLRESM